MNGPMIIVLKTILAVTFLGFSYLVWKTYKKQEWNRLLLNKQKAFGKVELLKVKYGVSYAFITICFLMFMFTFNSPLGVVNSFEKVNDFVSLKEEVTEEEAIEEIVQNLDLVEGDMYIVAIEGHVATMSFNLLKSDANTDLKNYYTYQTNVLEEVYATNANMFTPENSNIVLDNVLNITTTNIGYSSSIEYVTVEATDLEYQEVYLIIGGYIDESESDELLDYRLDGSDYIFSYTAILLEGYDLEKPLSMQSEEIQEIVRRYSDQIPDE